MDMKRHPGLIELSRDHHHALVLARGLGPSAPSAPSGGLSSDPIERVASLRRVWHQTLGPHFRREERALVPHALCGDEDLRRYAETVLAAHAALRHLTAQLTPDNVFERGPELGQRLEAHVRFEERQWFPALEAALDDETLDRLGRRMEAEPAALIAGYHRDDEGVWVAELDCGHARHIRHKPPLQLASWITTAEGREGMLGSKVGCPLCRMPALPPCARPYKQTAVFDVNTMPSGLARSHELKANTWAELVVEEGRLPYVLEDEEELTIVLRPGTHGVIAPCRPHHVEPLAGTRFRVRFLRCQLLSD